MNTTIQNKTRVQYNETVELRTVKTLAYAAILFASLLGNILLILGIKRNINGRMRTVSNLLIASLAVSDLMLTIWSFPERMTRTATNDKWLIPGVGGSILCKIVNFTEKLAITVSVLHLGALALERFLAIIYPYRTIIKLYFVKYITGSIWIFSALYWSPILYYGKIIGQDELRCKVRRFAKYWKRWYLAFIVLLCGVMLAILLLYTMLAVSLCRRKNTAIKLASQRHKSDHIKRRVVAMVGVIIVTFYVCFLPYWIGWVCCSYAITMPKQICNKTYKFISIFLSNMSCMANPIICFTFIGYFRFAFRAILLDPFNRKQRQLRVRLRRRSSQTELDSVNDKSKNSGKEENPTLQEKQTSKKDSECDLNNGKTPLINSRQHSGIVPSPLKRKIENTDDEADGKSLENFEEKTGEENTIHNSV